MKAKFYKKHDKKYLALGFTKKGLELDPEFFYHYELIPEDIRTELDLSEDDAPCLLVGKTQLNQGICLAIEGHFIWLNVGTPEEAIEWSKKILAFEAN